MAKIRTVSENSADEMLALVYDRITGGAGSVGNILKVQSLLPPSLATHYDFYRTIMFGRSPLRRVDREMIAVVVSQINQCHN